MIGWRALFRSLAADWRGTAAIETALVAPILVSLALGTFDAGSMVARQSELQTATAEAAAIVRAKPPTTADERTTVRDIVALSANVPSGNVTVTEIYRCGTATSYVTTNNCSSGTQVSTYIRVIVTATYSPTWTNFGLGSAISYNVNRVVQIS
ncbi:MAG: TadE/TadG family type IV pilus assembly protein [Croceibacterium sp.]